MRIGSLFSGIGGFEIGFEWAGMLMGEPTEIVWQVEIDKWCRDRLAEQWPDAERFNDVKTCGKNNLKSVNIICGGFPCQPHSVAGKRKGKEDDRYLWPEMFRIIAEIQPRWVIAENVSGIVNMALDNVLSDLEGEDYTCWTFNIPACGINAPHRRERIWIVANNSIRRFKKRQCRCMGKIQTRQENNTLPITESDSSGEDVSDSDSAGWREQRWAEPDHAKHSSIELGMRGQPESRMGSTDDVLSAVIEQWPHVAPLGMAQYDFEPNRTTTGFPDRAKWLKALGNAVVPVIPMVILSTIIEWERKNNGKIKN